MKPRKRTSPAKKHSVKKVAAKKTAKKAAKKTAVKRQAVKAKSTTSQAKATKHINALQYLVDVDENETRLMVASSMGLTE